MLNFTYIRIKNFNSISDVEISLEKGIYNIIGENGAGKTTILMAFLQGLFNKNIKTNKDSIDTTYNKHTNLPYYIEIHFTKDNTLYKIINDRSKNTINIIENGVNISKKGIKQQLQQIEDIIGLDYNIFSAFFYLSINTLNNIFDISNEQNLIFKFFDIETLNNLQSYLKKEKKELNNRKEALSINIRTLNSQITNIKNIKPIDINKLELQKVNYLESLNSLKNSDLNNKIIFLENNIKILNNKLSELNNSFIKVDTEKTIIGKHIKELNSGSCPVCGQETTGIVNEYQQKYKDINTTHSDLKDKVNKLKDIIKNKKEELKELQEEYNNKVLKLEQQISNINSQILMYNSNKEELDKLKDTINGLEKSKEELEQHYNSILLELNGVTTLLSILSSKVLIKKYLSNFILLLNKVINNLIEKLNLNFNIIIYENNGKLKFKFIYNDVEVNLNNLSSGEKTRVSIVVLFSILETLKTLSNTQFSILALDEILGVLDKKGVSLLKDILDIYRKNLTIFLIQHHKEIDEQFFDYTLPVYKRNNLTYIKDIKDGNKN